MIYVVKQTYLRKMGNVNVLWLFLFRAIGDYSLNLFANSILRKFGGNYNIAVQNLNITGKAVDIRLNHDLND